MKKVYNVKITTNKMVVAETKEKAREVFNKLYAKELSKKSDVNYLIEEIDPLSKPLKIMKHYQKYWRPLMKSRKEIKTC